MIIIYRGPKSIDAHGPELWVPEKTAYLPEQSFVATGLRSRCEAVSTWRDGLTFVVIGVRCEV